MNADFKQWLETYGLSNCTEAFTEYGINSAAVLATTSDAELEVMGIPLAARNKIRFVLGPPPEVPTQEPQPIRNQPTAKPKSFIWVIGILATFMVVSCALVATIAIKFASQTSPIAPVVDNSKTITKSDPKPKIETTAVPKVVEPALVPEAPLTETTRKTFPIVSTEAATYQDHILPMLETYCYKCHAADEIKGGVDMSPYTTADSLMVDRKFWLNVLEQIETEEMPTKKPLPTKDERHLMVAWIDKKINDIDWAAIRDAGHVTIPRLTHVEYRNTMRDLLGVDPAAISSFSADGEGQSGFTTDRDNLFITPDAMEKYFAAAEEAVNLLGGNSELGGSSGSLNIKLEAEKMASPVKPNKYGNFTGRRLQVPQTTLYEVIEFPVDGNYTFTLRGLSTDGNIAGVRLRIGEKVKGDIVIKGKNPTNGTLTCFVKKGSHQIAWNKENSVLPPAIRKKLKRGVFLGAMAVDWMSISGPGEVEVTEKKPLQQKRVIVRPGPALTVDKAARQTIFVFTQRAFRRPVEDEVLARYFKIYQQSAASGMNYDQSIKMALTAVLVSPKFLFRHEFSPSGAVEGEFELDHFQIASRLSYFLWQSMPDGELFSLAKNGKLKDPKILRAQVRRMLSDPKSRSFTAEFLGQWLGFASIGIDLIPDKKVFPSFDQKLAKAMKQETVLTFEHLVKADHSLLNLLDTKATFLNEQLAELYGVSGVKGAKMRAIRLDDPNRGGLLGMASVLTATSSSTRTSPVLRGKWVLETLLGEHIPEPPADAGELPADAGQAGLSLREELEMHRNKAGCRECHSKIDPIGFGMENFSGIGQFRTKHNGKPIDNKGELDGFAFTGVDELKSWLKAERKEAFLRNISERMLAFGLGRELKTFDEGPVLEILAALEANENRAITLLEEIVLSYPFHHQNNSPSKY